jgi:hypothetical protein
MSKWAHTTEGRRQLTEMQAAIGAVLLSQPAERTRPQMLNGFTRFSRKPGTVPSRHSAPVVQARLRELDRHANESAASVRRIKSSTKK